MSIALPKPTPERRRAALVRAIVNVERARYTTLGVGSDAYRKCVSQCASDMLHLVRRCDVIERPAMKKWAPADQTEMMVTALARVLEYPQVPFLGFNSILFSRFLLCDKGGYHAVKTALNSTRKTWVNRRKADMARAGGQIVDDAMPGSVSGSNPLQEAIHAEALNKLTPEEQSLYKLKLAGYSATEIADGTGVDPREIALVDARIAEVLREYCDAEAKGPALEHVNEHAVTDADRESAVPELPVSPTAFSGFKTDADYYESAVAGYARTARAARAHGGLKTWKPSPAEDAAIRRGDRLRVPSRESRLAEQRLAAQRAIAASATFKAEEAQLRATIASREMRVAEGELSVQQERDEADALRDELREWLASRFPELSATLGDLLTAAAGVYGRGDG